MEWEFNNMVNNMINNMSNTDNIRRKGQSYNNVSGNLLLLIKLSEELVEYGINAYQKMPNSLNTVKNIVVKELFELLDVINKLFVNRTREIAVEFLSILNTIISYNNILIKTIPNQNPNQNQKWALSWKQSSNMGIKLDDLQTKINKYIASVTNITNIN